MTYFPVLLLLLAGILMGGIILWLSNVLGRAVPHPRKNTPFECGMPVAKNYKKNHRVSVHFYLVAILFLLFDVEIVFFYPWAIIFKEYLQFGPFILIEMVFFSVILAIGYLYLYSKKVLDWE